jgi:hypothetical protein
MLNTKTKLSIVTAISIILVSLILLVNQKIMRDIESMQTTAGKISQKVSQTQTSRVKRTRTSDSFSGSPIDKEEIAAESKHSSRIISDKKGTSKIIYEMPSYNRVLMQ